MGLEICPCVVSDAPELARIHLAIFTTPIYRVIYAGVKPADVLAKYEKGFREGLESQENPSSSQIVYYVKAIDDMTGEIAAYAVWVLLPQGYNPAEDPQTDTTGLPDGSNMPVVLDFKRAIAVTRQEHDGRLSPHYLIALLGTHPKHERRGAATQLIKWGCERADVEDLPCYVDSSITGHALYRKLGFRAVGAMEVDLDRFEGGQGLGVQRWIAMLREPVNQNGES